MARSRKQRKKSTGYQTLENRRLLAADSTFFFDVTSGTLHISAEDTNVAGEQYANELTLTRDAATNELVATEANRPEQRFSTAGLDRISYRGTNHDDLFVNLTDIDTRAVGFAGNDNITTGGGEDRVIGGNGDDIIRTGNGNDYAAGNQGDDQILEAADDGRDRFFGGPGADVIDSGIGIDFVSGNEGDDILRLGEGNDISFGGDGADEIFAGEGRDFVYGGSGDDMIHGEAGPDRLLGQSGADEIHGGAGDDSIVGGDEADMLFGGFGADRVVGGEGNDVLDGGEGLDRIVAATANSLNSSYGQDTIRTGDDTAADLVLSHPVDTIDGESNDVLVDTNQVRLNQQASFLVSNATAPGWSVTDSGLQYRTVVSGSGVSPSATDQVRVNYEGTFIDGTLFDFNDDISFGLNQVIAGWTEGLQLMRTGGTTEFAIPADLAYGDAGRPGIPSGSTLLFTVDLIEVI